jgi:hypothetical protein
MGISNQGPRLTLPWPSTVRTATTAATAASVTACCPALAAGWQGVADASRDGPGGQDRRAGWQVS